MGPLQPVPPEDSAIRVARIDDPLARPLLDELRREYGERYGDTARGEMTRFPDSDFAPPDGLLLLLVLGGRPVAGGAFRRYDEDTAEVKRMWTASDSRRRGYASLVLAALERAAAQAGYGRVHLTTGPRQPEARGLYLAAGYRPGFDVHADPETIGPLVFDKDLRHPWPHPVAGADLGPHPAPGSVPPDGANRASSQHPVPDRGLALDPCTGQIRGQRERARRERVR